MWMVAAFAVMTDPLSKLVGLVLELTATTSKLVGKQANKSCIIVYYNINSIDT